MIDRADLLDRFEQRYGRPAEGVSFGPGRVNLIGEHIDYHGGPVLPMALERGVSIAWAPREDGRVRAEAGPTHPPVTFDVADPGAAVGEGDWGDYLRAAAAWFFGVGSPATGTPASPHGADLLIDSDLPEASGLSSSSALVVAGGLVLLAANGRIGVLDDDRRRELANACAAAERYVGTAGGGMDQAACLGGITGHALRITFDPLTWQPISLPDDLAVLVAHTGVRAEKSGEARARYNAIRAGAEEPEIAEHIRSERRRVHVFVDELQRSADPARLGKWMNDSHTSLTERLRVGHPALDLLCDAARSAGALGARLTGAGFGGSIVALVAEEDAGRVRDALREAQARLPGAVPAFVARAGAGARVDTTKHVRG